MLLINKLRLFINKNKGLLGILPAFIFVLFFLGIGTIQSLMISLGAQPEFYGEHGLLGVYKELYNVSFIRSLGITAGIALLVSILSGLIGLFAALLLASASYKRRWMHVVLQLPIGVPHLLAGYMLTQVFMQTGWYSRISFRFGWIDTFEHFPSLIHDEWGIGVIIAYLWKEIPFIVLLTYPFVSKQMVLFQDTSKILGASFMQMVRWVIVPMVMPIWVGGMWIVFAFTLTAYEIPALLASTSLHLVPVLAWQEYTQFGLERQPLAIAMNLVLAGVSFIIGIFLMYLQKKWYEEGRRVWKD
ncbi:ABC transporter permease subunit [Neobacillus sp. LXY-4]|uniref:ABC transporter permease subunit n=1 Tax=Neobacillus sp. LXY-4 TaxID=3379826 RepID=UPI003EDFB263